jgi:hypothetical protein
MRDILSWLNGPLEEGNLFLCSTGSEVGSLISFLSSGTSFLRCLTASKQGHQIIANITGVA